MQKEENLKSDDEKMFKKYEKLKNFVMDLGKHQNTSDKKGK